MNTLLLLTKTENSPRCKVTFSPSLWFPLFLWKSLVTFSENPIDVATAISTTENRGINERIDTMAFAANIALQSNLRNRADEQNFSPCSKSPCK